ncbi:MAG: sugar phosphate isomerase/epimerase [Gemmatimonadetes bacterium]|nr:sugar phosphate isomerase/epimerase [Gemmatimonadota bacterium]
MTQDIDRREFLTRAALGAAAFGLGCASLQSAQRASEPGVMFVSLPPWAVARNVGWPEQARLAARVGYKGIDWPFGAVRQAGVDATRALLAELNIVPTIVNLPMRDPLGPDDDAFEAQLPKLEEDAAFCQAIGCSRFQFVLSPTTLNGQTKAERWAHVQSRLAAISPILAKHEMRMGLEFLGPLVFRMRPSRGGAPPDMTQPPPVPFVWTLRDTLELAEASGPSIGVTLDAWHWYHSRGTVGDIRAANPSRIVHVHVSDARPMPAEKVRDDMRWLPGEGAIDLVGFFRALKAIGYRGGIAPETIGPRIPADMPPEESARIALEATLKVMRKAGVA